MMADDAESDACVGTKRRMTEIEETLLQQQEEPSASISAQEEEVSKESSFTSSSPQEDQEIVQDIHSPTSSKKVKCSVIQPYNSIEENQGTLGCVDEGKVISCDLVSSSIACEGNIADFARTVENLGMQVQETNNCMMDSVFGSEKGQGEIEGTLNDGKSEKEGQLGSAKSEMGFHGAEEVDKLRALDLGDHKGTEIEIGSVIVEECFVKGKAEAETLLDAKKKQLLAKLEAGSIFKDKSHMEKVPVPNLTAGILEGLKRIDESVRPSLKVEVIDDTALIETVPVPKTGNVGVKVAERKGKKNEKQEADEKKAKRPRRKGKDGKKILEPSYEQNQMIPVRKAINNTSQVGEAQNGGKKDGDQIRKYSREEMEALRFVNIVDQRRLWRLIHTGLGDAVVKEYNDLTGSKHQKNICVNFDPRQLLGRKEVAPGILGE